MSNNLQILKLFSRKLSNCRFKVPVQSIVEYMEKGQFGYSVKEGEDEVITNDSVFASTISVVIREIRGIFRNPRLHLRKEELVQNVSVASHFDNETLRKTYKDSSLWKVNTDGVMSPESVHTFVYEDDYTIYENRFLTALIDELYGMITRKINAIQASLTTLNSKITDQKDVVALPDFEYVDLADKEGGIPVILGTKDARVFVLEALIRNKKKLQVLMHSNVYKSCKKKGEFILHRTNPTNILMQDKNYHVCYDFYVHYLRREVDLTTPEKMYESFVFVNLLCALHNYGYVCKDVDADVFVDSRINIKFEDVTLVKAPFEVTLSKGREDDLLISVLNTVSGSVMHHRVKTLYSESERLQGETKAKQIYDEFRAEFDSDACKTWIVSDLTIADSSTICLQPSASVSPEKLLQLVKKFTLLAEGALTVYARICPVCGSSMVSPTDKDYACVSCDCMYHLFYYEQRDLIWVKRLPKEADAVSPFSSYIKRHFFAKISQMEEDKKEYYSELKNYIMQYKKVSARASWACETFSNRRIPKIRLAVRGKTLVAFFALDPKAYEDSKYHGKDMSDTKKFADTPMMVKVKSDRGLKFAKELVDIVLDGLAKNEKYEPVDYKIPYKSDKQLLEEGLIKVFGDVELSDEIIQTIPEEVEEKDDVSEETVETTAEEPVAEEVAAAEEPVVEEVAVTEAVVAPTIKRHFYAKIAMLEQEKKDYYNELKNCIMQYKKVSARASWAFETFSSHRAPLVRIAVRGKTLVAFFALNPKDYENSKYFPKDMSGTKKFEETPMMVKVKSERGLKYAKELVKIVMANQERNHNASEWDYRIDYMSDREMYALGWLKLGKDMDATELSGDIVTEAVEEVAEPVETKESAVAEVAVSDGELFVGDSVRVKKHFLAKIAQIEEDKKDYYNELKNCIMQYKKVSARASWAFETFSSHRVPLVRMAVRGKTLVAFFALNPKDYEDSKYFPKDMSGTKKFEETPMMVKVKSERGLKYAKELVEVVMANEVKKDGYVAEDFKLPYQSDNELFADGLIKISGETADNE